MRLVSYNILEGLRPVPLSGYERRHIDRDRAALVQGIIENLSPDILVLNEALFCQIYGNKKVDYGHFLGFEFQSAALYDDAWGNAILSRYPIVRSKEMRIYNRGGLVAVINSPSGPLTVASYHPHPRRYAENKAQDFSMLVTGLTGPLIVCGDFNCINPEDDIDRDQLIDAFQPFSTDAEAAVDLFIKSGRLVFRALGEHGLRDVIPKEGRRYTIPTDLINSNKSSAIRIDHIMANDEIEVISGEVLHDENTNQASDHHPVVLEFELAYVGESGPDR
jgi:endonuclease/exonuclease/phosphatase family metal-dependent hydrolase